MTRSRRTSLVQPLLQHLWDHRSVAVASVRCYQGMSWFDLETPAGVKGTVRHTWDSSTSAYVSYEGRTIHGGAVDDAMTRQLMSSLQIMRMLDVFDERDEPTPDYRVGRIMAGLVNVWSRDTPMRSDALSRLDRAVASEILATRKIGNVRGVAIDARHKRVRLSSDLLGQIVLPARYRAIRNAVDHVLASKVGEVVLGASRPLPRLPQTDGSGRLTRTLQLCQKALTLDPEMRSSNGSPVRPLIEDHVPELFARHRAAVEVAEAADIPAIDAELEIGISVVVEAIQGALRNHADERRRELSEQIAFLQARHPAEGVLSLSEANHKPEEPRT